MPAGAPLNESVTGLAAVTLGVNDSGVPTDPEIDEPILTIRGTDYHINDPKPDGIGGVLLTLRKVT